MACAFTCKEDLMSEQAVLGHSAMRVETRADAEVKYESDPGPWLFFGATLSFVLTLATLTWLSLSTF
jgi:hypothetical protein